MPYSHPAEKDAAVAFDLPVAKSDFASEIIASADKLARFVSAGINPNQFLAMMVAEANSLSFQMKPEELAHPLTKVSFLKASFNAAVVGLLPGPALAHCYLIPFWNTKRSFREIIYIPGYRGYLELAFATRFLTQCDPEVVLQGEFVERGHNENGPWIKHEIPTPRGQDSDRSTIVGTYCTYKTSRGGRGVVYMDRPQIDAVDTKKNIWQSNFAEMCMKSPIRRAAKRWQLSRQMAHAIMLDEEAESDRTQTPLVSMDDPVDGAGQDIDLSALPEASE